MERSGFFDSEVTGHNTDGTPIYDREYMSEFFALYFSSFIGNGVFPNPATGLQVVSNNDMTIILKSGKAWINGYFYENTDNLILNVDVADGVLNRIDRIVLRLDFLERKIKAVIKKGAFAGTAIAPVLQRDTDAYEIALADILVNKGVISISQANIIDLRLNKDLCGIVHGAIEQVDTTAIFNQYLDWYNTRKGQYETEMSNMEQQFQSDFNTWFNSIKDTLSGDTAGNLLNLINEHKSNTNNPHNVTAAQIGAVSQTDFNSHKADDVKHIDYAVANGTNTYTATITNITTLTEGLSVKIKFTNANTGASTLNLNSLGTKTIQKGNGNALSSGNIKAGQICHLVYTGSVFQLLGEGGEYGTATSSEVLSGYTLGTDNGIVNGVLALIGTAGVGDVISGKTFYNTNAKTLLTGTATIQSLGGKRSQGGTGSTTSTGTFSVSGLPFQPSVVICSLNFNGTTIKFKIYCNNLTYGSYLSLITVNTNSTGTSPTCTPETAIPTTVTSNGFSGTFGNYTDSQNKSFNWIAIE